MNSTALPALFSPEQKKLWRESAPCIWSPTHTTKVEDPARSVMKTLWDQPRWLEAYHLYDDRGSELFERISQLPEYYLTRTEDAILERNAAKMIAAAPVECIVELGAGYSKKTVHLLSAQTRQRGHTLFAPIDVSAAGILVSRDAIRRDFPNVEFCGLHARYEEGFNAKRKALPTLFVFLGSTIGNFNPPAFVRFFTELSNAMGPHDYLLLGADRVKDIGVLERAYADSQGLTAQFILNVFSNINRLTASNFDLSKMAYRSWFNPEWSQIEMYAVGSADQEIRFQSFGTSFNWHTGERILVEISRKFDPHRLQEQFRYFGLQPVEHFTDPQEWFSLLLFKKSTAAE